MPVMSGGKLIGVISLGDILKSPLTEKDRESAVLLDHGEDPRILFGLASVCRCTHA
jgi:CBS domain-containing protein